MIENTKICNERAWNFRAYEWWEKYNGPSNSFGEKIALDPNKYINRRFKPYLTEIAGRKILNPLGSNGRKAVPLAKLGAELTVIDISEENKRYAVELAEAAGVSLNYIVEDFSSYTNEELEGQFDFALSEGGILHYFSEIDQFFTKVSSYLRSNGVLILNDFHPYRKMLSPELGTTGNYFDSQMHQVSLPYENSFSEGQFPKCKLRFYTLAEIINSSLRAGFALQELHELPDRETSSYPSEFTLIARKM